MKWSKGGRQKKEIRKSEKKHKHSGDFVYIVDRLLHTLLGEKNKESD